MNLFAKMHGNWLIVVYNIFSLPQVCERMGREVFYRDHVKRKRKLCS